MIIVEFKENFCTIIRIFSIRGAIQRTVLNVFFYVTIPRDKHGIIWSLFLDKLEMIKKFPAFFLTDNMNGIPHIECMGEEPTYRYDKFGILGTD